MQLMLTLISEFQPALVHPLFLPIVRCMSVAHYESSIILQVFPISGLKSLVQRSSLGLTLIVRNSTKVLQDLPLCNILSVFGT